MSDPLEIAAKARHDSASHRANPALPSLWEALSKNGKSWALNDMRTALLAMADADLPEEVSKIGRETLLSHGKGSDDMFRAMLRSIAGGSHV